MGLILSHETLKAESFFKLMAKGKSEGSEAQEESDILLLDLRTGRWEKVQVLESRSKELRMTGQHMKGSMKLSLIVNRDWILPTARVSLGAPFLEPPDKNRA